MKKITILMISLFCFGVPASDIPTAPDCFTIEELAGGNAKVASYKCTDQAIKIPSRIGGLKIKVIGAGAFEGQKLVSVVIPNGVKTIEEKAFHKCYLEHISLPDSIEVIEGFAFWYGELTKVRLPNNLRELGYGAFSTNKIKDIVLPHTVTKIGPAIFYQNKLETAILSNGLTNIPEMAFFGNNLRSIVIPNKVESVGDIAFADNKLLNVTLPDSLKVIKRGAFRNNMLREAILPLNLKLIEQGAFSHNQLTRIELPEKTEMVEENAFKQNLASYAKIPGKTFLKDALDVGVKVERFGPSDAGIWAKYDVVRERNSVTEEFITFHKVFLSEDQRDYIIHETSTNKATGEIKVTSRIIDPRFISLDRAKEQRDRCEKRGGQIELKPINGKNIKTCREEQPDKVYVYAEVPFGFYMDFTSLGGDIFSFSEKKQLLDFGKHVSLFLNRNL